MSTKAAGPGLVLAYAVFQWTIESYLLLVFLFVFCNVFSDLLMMKIRSKQKVYYIRPVKDIGLLPQED